MPTIPEIRAKFPQYNDMSDDALAEGLHKKYYSDMPFGEFAGKIGYRRNWSDMPGQAVSSAGGNTSEILGGFKQLIMHPADTLGSVGELAAGGVDNLVGMGLDALGIDRGTASPEQSNRRGAASDAGAQIADTLTTAEGFKHYIARKPVSAGLDAATLLTGGGSVIPKLAGRARGPTLSERLLKAPSQEDVAAQTTAKFNAIRDKNIQLPRETFVQGRDALGRFLKEGSVTPEDAPRGIAQARKLDDILPPHKQPEPTRNMYGHLQHPVPQPDMRTVPLNEVESVRRGAGRVERAPNLSDTAATDKMVAGKVKKTIDSIYKDSGIPGLQKEMADAREMGRRNILAKHIKEMVRQGEEYRSGAESGIGNKFASYLKSEKGKGLTPEERKAFRQVSRREGIAGVVSTFGGKLGLLTSALAGGPVGVGVSLGSRKLAEALVRSAAKKAEKTALIGRDAQKAGSQASRELRLEMLAKALLAAQASR